MERSSYLFGQGCVFLLGCGLAGKVKQVEFKAAVDWVFILAKMVRETDAGARSKVGAAGGPGLGRVNRGARPVHRVERTSAGNCIRREKLEADVPIFDDAGRGGEDESVGDKDGLRVIHAEGSEAVKPGDEVWGDLMRG